MDGLRWLLLLFGLLVIAGVYLYSRREKQQPPEVEEEIPVDRREPTLDDDLPDLDSGNYEAIDAPAMDDAAEAPPAFEGGPQKIVTLRIVGRNKKPFQGDELILWIIKDLVRFRPCLTRRWWS